jgi:hypothetical protein
VFSNPPELAALLLDWFKGYPTDLHQQEQSKKFRDNIKTWANLRWDQNWKTSAAAIFTYE